MPLSQRSRLERLIGTVLRYGMAVSLTVLVIGLVLFALSPSGHEEVDLSLEEILRGSIEGNPIAVIDLGIVLLIATPLTRVVTAMMVFAVDRDWRFALVALAVLALLTLAVAVG